MNFYYEDEIYFEKDKKFFLRNKNKEKNEEKKNKNLLIASTRQSTKRLNEKNTININETNNIKNTNNNNKFNHNKKKSFSSKLNIYEKSKKEKILFEKKIQDKKNELIKLELSNSKRNFKASKSSQNILNKINYTSIFKRVNKINSLDTKLLKIIINKENNNKNFKKKNKNYSFEKFLFNNNQTLRNKEKTIKQINKLNKEDEFYDLKEYTFHPIINKKNLSFKNDISYNLNINKSILKKHIIKNNENFNFKPKINKKYSNKTLIENYSQKILNYNNIIHNKNNNDYFIECKNIEINPFLQIQTISELTEESQKNHENSPINYNNNNFIYKRKIVRHKSKSEDKIYNINTSNYLPNNNLNKKENLNIVFLNLNNKSNLSILNDLL